MLSREERRCGAGRVIGARVGEVIEVHRRGVELEEATYGQRGGLRGRWSVDLGAAVGVGTARGVQASCEWRMEVERVCSSAGCSF
jgi:hypothetical protein